MLQVRTKRMVTRMKKRIGEFSTQKLISNVIKCGTQIVFLISLAILSYLSFVDSFTIKPSLKTIGIISVIGIVLNYVVWDSWYSSNYEKSLLQDRLNSEYSIHRRYYHARKGWKYEELQKYIRDYNRNFTKQWEIDVEDITGRTVEDIRNEPYRGHDHKLLIYRIKKHIYPKSGIRTPKDLLYILSVSGSDTMKIDVHEAEHMHTKGRITKFISSVLSMFLAASIAIEFVQGDIYSAIFTFIINVAILFMSLFFGAMSGAKAAKVKLSTVEKISELLEEWRNEPPFEEPYKEHSVYIAPSSDDKVVPIVKSVEKTESVIEIT